MILKDMKVETLDIPQTSGTGDPNSQYVTWTNYDGVMIVTNVASASVVLQQYDGTDTTTLKTVTLDTSTQTTVVFDVYRPRQSLGNRMRLAITRNEASVYAGTYAILYNGRVKPIDSESDDATRPTDVNVLIIPAAE